MPARPDCKFWENELCTIKVLERPTYGQCMRCRKREKCAIPPKPSPILTKEITSSIVATSLPPPVVRPTVSPIKSTAARVVRGTIGLAKATLHISRAPLAVIEERQGICNKCEHAIVILKGITTKCRICGCFVAAKVKLADESCPLNFWKKVSLPVINDR